MNMRRHFLCYAYWMGEVGKGGFSQYFFNSNEIYIEETKKRLEILNNADYIKIFNNASEIFYSEKSEEEKDKI